MLVKGTFSRERSVITDLVTVGTPSLQTLAPDRKPTSEADEFHFSETKLSAAALQRKNSRLINFNAIGI